MPLSRLYSAVVTTRNFLYRKGIFRSSSLGAPTISVGNITVGGTGKTPLVAYVAEMLAERGETAAILSRGYGRQDPGKRVLVSDKTSIRSDVAHAGDEPFELARKLLGKAIVISDADRVSAGIWARDSFGVTAFVLDDAFQHHKVERDLNIVVIDATNPFGNGKVLPFGILREPLSSLKRADLIVISRANLSSEVDKLKTRLQAHNLSCPVISSEYRISGIYSLEDFNADTTNAFGAGLIGDQDVRLTGRKCLAFCALGNSDNFFEQLQKEDFDVSAVRSFPDHHQYSRKDVDSLEKRAISSKAEILVTTAKDAVKLKARKFEIPCYVIEVKPRFDNEDLLRQLINAAVDDFKTEDR